MELLLTTTIGSLTLGVQLQDPISAAGLMKGQGHSYFQPGSLGYLPRCSAHGATPVCPQGGG